MTLSIEQQNTFNQMLTMILQTPKEGQGYHRDTQLILLMQWCIDMGLTYAEIDTLFTENKIPTYSLIAYWNHLTKAKEYYRSSFAVLALCGLTTRIIIDHVTSLNKKIVCDN